MTILPKKKSSQPKSDRDSSGSVDNFTNRGLPQNQAVVVPTAGNTAPGWGPGVGPTSGASGWSPPVAGTSWVSTGPQSGSSLEDAQGSAKKRPALPEDHFDFDDPENGPSPSKRRMHDEADQEEAGYNSEDEYNHFGVQLTEEEWIEKDRKFEQTMRKKGYIIKKTVEDGSCLFRAVADQIYGDQEMHASVRKHCMDYLQQNSEYFSQYLTEDIHEYIARKRYLGVQGNHLEIQALSEMYNRPIHIYSYSAEPMNSFQGLIKNDGQISAPIRLAYYRLCHYNSLVDPFKPTIGVGLGLPGFSPGSADRNQLKQAVKKSDSDLVERTMLEDKIRATDWEATNEAIEEQVARESYFQWLRDNERRQAGGNSKSATVTSADLKAATEAATAATTAAVTSSPSRAKALKEEESTRAARSSPKPGCSHSTSSEPAHFASSPKPGCSSQSDSPKPCCSSDSQKPCCSSLPTPSPSEVSSSGNDYGLGDGFALEETASFLNRLPPNMFGLDDWNDAQCDADVLTQVLAASQQEYLDSLKTAKESETSQSRRNSSEDSNQEVEHRAPSGGNNNGNVNSSVSNTNNSSSAS